MAGTALHMEALRKTRMLERKSEAMKKLQEKYAQSGYIDNMDASKQPGPMFSETGHYAQNRQFSKYPPEQTNRKKFVRRQKEDIIRKPTPDSVKQIPRDHVFYILHPSKLTYYNIGTVRDQLQYDHSRDGPVVDSTNYRLKREFNFLGNSLSMLKDDVIADFKPTPLCRY